MNGDDEDCLVNDDDDGWENRWILKMTFDGWLDGWMDRRMDDDNDDKQMDNNDEDWLRMVGWLDGWR